MSVKGDLNQSMISVASSSKSSLNQPRSSIVSSSKEDLNQSIASIASITSRASKASITSTFSFKLLYDFQFSFQELDYDFEIWLAALKQANIPSLPQKSQDETIRDIIVAYFSSRLHINITSQHFSQRPQPIYNQSIEPIYFQYILFGVDFLSTEMINKMFYPCKFLVRWINDSSCHMYFLPQNAQSIFMFLKNPNDYYLVNEDDDGESLYRGWCQLKSYYIFGIERKLYLRHAATNDRVNYPKETANSFAKFTAFRRHLPIIFLERFNAINIYKDLLREKVEKELKMTLMNTRYFKKNCSYDSYNQQIFEERSQLNDTSMSFNGLFDHNDTSFSILGNVNDQSGLVDKDNQEDLGQSFIKSPGEESILDDSFELIA